MSEPRPLAPVPTLVEVSTLSAEAVAAALARLHAEQAQLAALEGALVDRLLALQAQPAPAEDELLPMPAAARLLGIPESKAREMGRRGQLPVVAVGKYVRVSRRALAAFMQGGPGGPVDRGLGKMHSRGNGQRNTPAAPKARRPDAAGARGSARRDREPSGAARAGRGPDHGADGAAREADAGDADRREKAGGPLTNHVAGGECRDG